jgi:putative molybdopterin biosynthesis protein
MVSKAVAQPRSEFQTHVRERRESLGLKQGEVARRAGMTRQALSAVEAGYYAPSTPVALRLALVLQCRVEDLFTLHRAREIVEGELVAPLSGTVPRTRVKTFRVGKRFLVTPMAALGSIFNFTLPADGLVVDNKGKRVRIELLRDRVSVGEPVVVAGCNPAVFLAGEYLRRGDQGNLLCLSMGSEASVQALRRGEVHVAGVHLIDESTGENNLPYLRRHLRGMEFLVVNFAAWEEGLIVTAGSPKKIRTITDLGRRDVRLINREEGSGARKLLDARLRAARIDAARVRGYGVTVHSHLDLGWMINRGFADVGVGAKVVASLFGLEFIPLQEERYDLVVPTAYLDAHPQVQAFLDTITTAAFRSEVEALGGYDTRDGGKIVARVSAN